MNRPTGRNGLPSTAFSDGHLVKERSWVRLAVTPIRGTTLFGVTIPSPREKLRVAVVIGGTGSDDMVAWNRWSPERPRHVDIAVRH